MSFDNFNALIFTKHSNNVSQTFSVLIIDNFSSILWAEHDVVSAEPFRVGKAVRNHCHKDHPFYRTIRLEQLYYTRKG